MKRIYIALLAATLTACNDRPADATTSGATTNDTTNGAPAKGATATPAKDMPPKEGEVLLRLNYPKGFGQEINYDVVTKTNAIAGNTGITVTYAVTGETNGVYSFTGSITGIKMATKGQGQTINYDSSKKLPANVGTTEKAIDKGFRDVQNKPFTFKLDKMGGIEQEVKFEGQGEDMQPVDLANFQIPFPEEPVAVGDDWSAKSPDKQTGGTRFNTYTVKKITDAIVVIDVKSVLPPSANMRGAKESVFTGTYTLDRETGMLITGSLSGFVDTLQGNVTMTFTGKKK